MRHNEITGEQAIHVFCFVSATDPALDAENEVTAFKGWWDTLEQRLKFRNATNTGWEYLAESA